jgi:putative Ca2+/H+ antiporter (TMEM165/GDT1 family)
MWSPLTGDAVVPINGILMLMKYVLFTVIGEQINLLAFLIMHFGLKWVILFSIFICICYMQALSGQQGSTLLFYLSDYLVMYITIYTFFVSGVKWSSCLSYVLHWAAHALHLVYAVLFIFVCLCIWFQYVLYGVFHFECNFNMCVFKELL